MNENTNCELYHYGILGQRWGVRRTEAQLARNKSSKSSNGSKKGEKPDIKKMTDDELNSIVRRMELEKRYRDLNPKRVSAGKQLVNTVINKTVVPAVTEASKQLLKDYIIKAGSNAKKK